VALKVTERTKILYLSLSFQLCMVEVRSAALFLSAQAQFRSQLTEDQSAHPQQFFLLRKLRKMRIAEHVADPPTSAEYQCQTTLNNGKNAGAGLTFFRHSGIYLKVLSSEMDPAEIRLIR
jgi:hypothetical protein